jgi:hypothetical protein
LFIRVKPTSQVAGTDGKTRRASLSITKILP